MQRFEQQRDSASIQRRGKRCAVDGDEGIRLGQELLHQRINPNIGHRARKNIAGLEDDTISP
jgi:hypothetical protein